MQGFSWCLIWYAFLFFIITTVQGQDIQEPQTDSPLFSQSSLSDLEKSLSATSTLTPVLSTTTVSQIRSNDKVPNQKVKPRSRSTWPTKKGSGGTKGGNVKTVNATATLTTVSVSPIVPTKTVPIQNTKPQPSTMSTGKSHIDTTVATSQPKKPKPNNHTTTVASILPG